MGGLLVEKYAGLDEQTWIEQHNHSLQWDQRRSDPIQYFMFEIALMSQIPPATAQYSN